MENSTMVYLEQLSQHFNEIDIETHLVEDDLTSNVHTLLLNIGEDYKGRTQVAGLTYIDELITEKEDDIPLILLQYLVELTPEVDLTDEGIHKLITFLNARMPIGHIGLQNGKVHFRYVMADLEISEGHYIRAMQTFFVFVDMLEIFQEPVEQYLSNEASLESIQSKFNQ